MARILVPPEELKATARTMANYGQQVDDSLQKMIDLVNNLEGQWEGVAQNKYYNEFNEQVPQSKMRIAEIVEGLATSMKRIAEEFEKVDQNLM